MTTGSIDDTPAAKADATPNRVPSPGPQTPQAPPMDDAPPKLGTPGLADPLLALLAEVLDDLERTRIANENRLRQLTRTEEDSDGVTRGLGLFTDDPAVARIASVVHNLAKLEREVELGLARQLRVHPLGPWTKRTLGLGPKQGPRLLAAIGDPYWNYLHDRPRTVSELWAYCGYHVLPASQAVTDTQDDVAGGSSLHPGQTPVDSHTPCARVSKLGDPDHGGADPHASAVGVAPSRAKGQRANWSANAKMRTYLAAEACMKGLRKPCQRADGDDYAVHVEGCTCFPYRLVYDAARVKYADALHKVECKRCGPSGKPAAIGSPLSAGHKHARALRVVSKEILKDLWREAATIHASQYQSN